VRIGFAPVLNSLIGGTYQYSATMLRTLYEWTEQENDDEFVVFADRVKHPLLKSLTHSQWMVQPLQPPSPRRLVRDAMLQILSDEALTRTRSWFARLTSHVTDGVPDLDVIQTRSDIKRWFQHFGVEFMVYSGTYTLAFETGIPYVMAIHDLQHRINPQFPEFAANGQWAQWEYLCRNGARYATLLLADSEVGKEDILHFYRPYGVTPDRVKVLPFLPATYLTVVIPESERQRVQRIYRLPERYFFYPAQFWSFKNHTRIVEALELVKNMHHVKLPIVFCGSHSGEFREQTFRDVMSRSYQLGVEDQIHYLGYVPDKDMSALYAGASALVMPTFCGPTNIPVIEAWAFGCPVLTSDIRGIREQVGDAALVVDPWSVEAIAEGIYRLWREESLRCTLMDRGRQRLASYSPTDFRQRLIEIVEEAKWRVARKES
jgi:glycosyltransferase involved in cell wall biosynthesis